MRQISIFFFFVFKRTRGAWEGCKNDETEIDSFLPKDQHSTVNNSVCILFNKLSRVVEFSHRSPFREIRAPIKLPTKCLFSEGIS